jgi:hypothetical protein
MLTRSQTKKVQFAVNIDFEEASRAWRENKRVLKNGCFTYIEPIKSPRIKNNQNNIKN